MTRASFTLEDSHTPISMPVSVLPAAATAQQESEESVTPRREEGSSGAPGPNCTGNKQERKKHTDTFVDDDAAE